MTENIVDIRSQAAQGRDRDEPGFPHCGRCGNAGLAATVMVVQMGAPEGADGYSAMVCDTCAQRVVDLLVNPHLLLTAQTTNPATMAADLMVDGTGIDRPDAISMLINAAEMLNTGEPEVVAYYEPDTHQDES